MTGITTRVMPLMVVENRAFGNRAYCAINEGLGKVMRFGGNDAEVLARLAWLRDVLGPALGEALRAARRHAAQAADRARASPWATRCTSATSPARACSCASSRPGWRARPTTATRSPTRLGLHRPATTSSSSTSPWRWARRMTDPARGIAGSSIVTAMCRNGTDFGIRVSGTGDRWFTAPVEMPVGLYFPGFSAADANPDMGDSAIVETIGLGGFAMAAAPAVVGFRRRRLGVGRGRLHPRDGARSRVGAQSRVDHSGARFRRRRRPASTCASSSRPASRRPSTPASPTASRASARSAPAWCARRWPASSTALRALARTWGVA